MWLRKHLFWLSHFQINQCVRKGNHIVLLLMLMFLAACQGEPSPPNTTIYAVSQNGTVYAVNGKTGTISWSQHMSGGDNSRFGISAGLTLDHGIIYTSSSVDGGYVYAFQAQTGVVRWHTQVHSQGIPSSPIFVNGVVYLSVTDPFVAVSAYTCELDND